MPKDHGPPPQHLVDFVRGLAPCDRALDIGCGDGRLTGELRCARVSAADVSAVALERARRRLPEADVVQLHPDEPLPLPDSAFDLVLCANTLEHVWDVQLLLSEARRVLQPRGGRLSGLAVLARGFEREFDPLSPHLRFFTRRSLARLLADLGFEVESLRRSGRDLLAVARR
ncbi:MAG: class I SAM-dependent methyltransferase [Actinobacteria bacterium]|nr:MAG: class I SAM-dependent methyltransferase [Actinomycetota bacterium]